MVEKKTPERKTVTVQVGAKTVELVELTFEESLDVDKYVPTDAEGMPSTISISKVYALAAVRKVDSELVHPTAGDLQWKHVMGKFTATEAWMLVKEFNQAFGGEVKGEALKNA